MRVLCAHTSLADPATLKPSPANPNRHSAHQIQISAAIIQEQGWRAPITVSKRSGLIFRVSPGESCSTSINQNRNTLMQELDRFGGVVVITTNLFGNYDEAMLRCIARHIEFRLPYTAMREQILRLHLPNSERVPQMLRGIAMAAHGLSGGDLLNVCLNAIEAASFDPDPQN